MQRLILVKLNYVILFNTYIVNTIVKLFLYSANLIAFKNNIDNSIISIRHIILQKTIKIRLLLQPKHSL